MPNLGPRNASTRTHRRWTEREAAEILAAQEASGLTVKEFASREGVSPQRLWRWRRARVSGVETPVFEEVARPARWRSADSRSSRCLNSRSRLSFRGAESCASLRCSMGTRCADCS